MSESMTIVVVIVAFLVIFPLFWFATVGLIMKIAGMSRLVDTSPLGGFLEGYGTGSARIRGMNFSNCLMVDRHEHGYLLRLWKIFGGGQKVILDEEIESFSERGKVVGRSVVMQLKDGRSIRFYGPLAKKMSS